MVSMLKHILFLFCFFSRKAFLLTPYTPIKLPLAPTAQSYYQTVSFSPCLTAITLIFSLIFDIIVLSMALGAVLKFSFFCDEKVIPEIFPPPPMSGN